MKNSHLLSFSFLKKLTVSLSGHLCTNFVILWLLLCLPSASSSHFVSFTNQMIYLTLFSLDVFLITSSLHLLSYHSIFFTCYNFLRTNTITPEFWHIILKRERKKSFLLWDLMVFKLTVYKLWPSEVTDVIHIA